MHTIGVAFMVIGILGFVLGIVIHCYGAKKHDSGWLIAGQDTSFRGILVGVLGILIQIFFK